MEKSDYTCDECGYEYFGTAGFAVGFDRTGLQTISCQQCEELLDVPLGAGFVDRYIGILKETSRPGTGPGHRGLVCNAEGGMPRGSAAYRVPLGRRRTRCSAGY